MKLCGKDGGESNQRFHSGREDDKLWPQPDREGRQELEVVLGNEHICFTVSLEAVSGDGGPLFNLPFRLQKSVPWPMYSPVRIRRD